MVALKRTVERAMLFIGASRMSARPLVAAGGNTEGRRGRLSRCAALGAGKALFHGNATIRRAEHGRLFRTVNRAPAGLRSVRQRKREGKMTAETDLKALAA